MKFICNGCANGQGDPCIVDVGKDWTVGVDDLRCVIRNQYHACKWEKYYDGKVENLQPTCNRLATNLQENIQDMVTNTCQAMDKGKENVAKATCTFGNLPKLTAEVFDRPDCPEWAKWAAVDKYRNAMWYEGEPKVVGSVFWNSQRGQIQEIPGKFDASDWQNSLIERTARFPDWAEVGGYVYDARNGYGKIVSGSVKSCYIEFDGGAGDFVPEAFAELKQARLRPYNAGEIPDLPFEVTERNSNFRTIVVSCQGNNVWLAGASTAISTEELMRDFTAKGSPCGVLEHLENGEWVK